MKHYETIIIVNPNLGDEEYGEIVSKFRDLIGTSMGVVVKLEEWGKQRLAYELKKFDNGIYVLVDYCGEPGLIVELERNLKLDERVLKYQTVKLADKADPEALIREEEENRKKRPVKATEDLSGGDKEYAEADESSESDEPLEAGSEPEDAPDEGAEEEGKATASAETDSQAEADESASAEVDKITEAEESSEVETSAETDKSASAEADSSASTKADNLAEADRPAEADEGPQDETPVQEEGKKES